MNYNDDSICKITPLVFLPLFNNPESRERNNTHQITSKRHRCLYLVVAFIDRSKELQAMVLFSLILWYE